MPMFVVKYGITPFCESTRVPRNVYRGAQRYSQRSFFGKLLVRSVQSLNLKDIDVHL